MKNLSLVLIAVAAVAVGVYFGLQSNQQPDEANPYAHLGGDFTLNSDKGPVSLSDFRGKVVPVYFGYTHCPDVCITSLNKVTAALKGLSPEERAQIQPIFVSVDPERDTPEKSGEYARYFDPQIIGLSGTLEQTAEIAKRYLVIYEKVAMEGSSMDYAVDHSSIIYVVGRDGAIHALVHHADSAESLMKYLQEALAG
jgi:protein SCO1/2